MISFYTELIYSSFCLRFDKLFFFRRIYLLLANDRGNGNAISMTLGFASIKSVH